MGSFKRNSLFPRASRAAQNAARRQWNATTSAKAIRQIEDSINHGNAVVSGASRAVGYAMRSWRKTSGWTESAVTRLSNADFGGVIREVARYARLGGAAAKMVFELLKSLGPLGSLISSLISSPARERKGGLEGDVQSAIQFLDAVAPEMLSGGGRKRARQATGRSTASISEQVNAAMELLESQGYEVKSPQEIAREARKPTYPGGVPTETTRGTPRRVVKLDIDGVTRQFDVTHPIVTKAYVTCQSSNVHSFSYDYDKSRLYVRFHPSSVPGRGKGTLYAYESVPPRKFLALLDAPSKGTWIWDNIRIRGTVSGHQHDYRLVAITGGYLPRKATYFGNGEEGYVGREMRFFNVGDRQFRTIRSSLPDSPAITRPMNGRGTNRQ